MISHHRKEERGERKREGLVGEKGGDGNGQRKRGEGEERRGRGGEREEEREREGWKGRESETMQRGEKARKEGFRMYTPLSQRGLPLMSSEARLL